MEVISIERSTYEELLTSFNSFVSQMMAMGSRGTDKRLGEWLSTETSFWVTIWQPNSFTNPPNFALPSFSYFLIHPRFTFISERNALIFQNPLFYTSFFRNFAAELKRSAYDL